LDTLEKLRARVPRIEVAVIQDGNHSLEVRKSSGRSTRDAWNEAIAAIRKWLTALR
jgi:predicted alpha/beta-hydrolase family hydrolase